MRQTLRRAGERGFIDRINRWFRVTTVSFKTETKPTPDGPKRAMRKSRLVRKARISQSPALTFSLCAGREPEWRPYAVQ